MKAALQKRIRRLRDLLLYYLVRVVTCLLRLLPRRPAIAIMRGVGRLLFFTATRMRQKTIRHLTMAYGHEKEPAEINRLARQVFRHFSTVLADMLRLPKLLDQGIDQLLHAQGAEHIARAMQDGRGVILLTGHFGNWEILGAWASAIGVPIKVVGKELFNPELDRLLVETRNQAGYINIARGKATREIIRTLNDGGAVGMLIDQDTKVPGVFVNFFGRPTHTPVGAAQLARKLGVDIVPAFIYLQDDLTYQIECGPAIALQTTDNPTEDLFNNTQKCSDACERMIRRYPEQWVWMHKRWKTQPESFGPAAVGSKEIFG